MSDSLSLPHLIIVNGVMLKPNLHSYRSVRGLLRATSQQSAQTFGKTSVKYTLASLQPQSKRRGLLHSDTILKAVDILLPVLSRFAILIPLVSGSLAIDFNRPNIANIAFKME